MKRCFNCMEEIDEGLSVCSVCGADLTQIASDIDQLTPGSILKERYYIGKSLGRGGFGITYLAFDLLLARKVAIKEYLPSGMASRMPEQNEITCSTASKDFFLRGVDRTIEESRKLAGFSNLESVVTVYDSFKANGTAYIVMEYLTGMTVKEYVRKNGNLSFSDARAIITPVLKTLDRVHRSGLIHRDIAPDNIFLCDDEDRRVKLLDFGSAKLTENLDEKSRTVVLKQGYAPIEQYSSTARQGTWTDVYAVAATLYFMLSGHVPMSAADRSTDDRLPDISTFCHEIPSDTALVLMKCLAVRPSDRPKTVGTLIDALSETTKEMPADAENTMILSKEEQVLMECWMQCDGDVERFTEKEKQILRKIGVIKGGSSVSTNDIEQFTEGEKQILKTIGVIKGGSSVSTNDIKQFTEGKKQIPRKTGDIKGDSSVSTNDIEQFTEGEKQILKTIGVIKDGSSVSKNDIKQFTEGKKQFPRKTGVVKGGSSASPKSEFVLKPAKSKKMRFLFAKKEKNKVIPVEKSIQSEPDFENIVISSSKTKAADNGVIQTIIAAVLIVSLIAAAVALIPKILVNTIEKDNNSVTTPVAFTPGYIKTGVDNDIFALIYGNKVYYNEWANLKFSIPDEWNSEKTANINDLLMVEGFEIAYSFYDSNDDNEVCFAFYQGKEEEIIDNISNNISNNISKAFNIDNYSRSTKNKWNNSYILIEYTVQYNLEASYVYEYYRQIDDYTLMVRIWADSESNGNDLTNRINRIYK